ncbi:ABC transporter permease [Gryllotalpicola protaetiae]|uniref:ABC transporter permease n=1 Tax=Gryllotalpicola protaetiae TaxID=2419771 RepID=A0A387C3E4_9MICO|nr:ABC transporter permease [Gryllotalpicola protaetiae]AYG05081.1 ABC transporter permease [Gryllotalpicola protaetiae]
MRTTLRDHAPTLLVAALAAGFGTALLQITGVLAAVIRRNPLLGDHETTTIMLNITAYVFIVIAVYVGGVVTTNTVATVVAGRRRTIALLRLIGRGAAQERARIAREGVTIGVAGAVIGCLVGTAFAAAVAAVAVHAGLFPPPHYSYANPVVLIAVTGVALTTWLATWVGSRRVLAVRPTEALGNAVEQDSERAAGGRGRLAAAIALTALGVAALGAGLAIGQLSPLGVLAALAGGLLSFTGIVLESARFIPPVLRLVGRLFARTQAGRLAVENALRHPERSARMTIGLVIGVTLVTTFAVTMQSFRDLIAAAQRAQPEVYEGTGQILDAITAVFTVLIGFSALIAAVGLVTSLSLNVLQRTRELGLLRALGTAAAQLRSMILAEAAALTLTALVIGLALGFAYGWVGTQSLIGWIKGSPGFIAPGVPWGMLAGQLAAAVVLTLAASVAPSRRATRVSPIAALAVD